MFDFSKYKILVLGDIMLDQYIHGQVTRISPEAPVPIVEHENREYKLGGAANVAANIEALGAKAILAGVVGDDEEKKIVHTLLDDLEVDAVIQTDKSRVTTLKTRILAGHQQILRVDKEDRHSISEEINQELYQKIVETHETSGIHAVIFEDYNKGLLSVEFTQRIIEYCSSNGIFTSADPKFRDLEKFHKVNLFKPNLKEAAAFLQVSESEILESKAAYSKQIRDRLSADEIWITLGAKGICGLSADEFKYHPTEVKKVIDVCGAGDAVIVLLTLLHISGSDLSEKATLSNLLGGLVCSRPGVTNITLEELIQARN